MNHEKNNVERGLLCQVEMLFGQLEQEGVVGGEKKYLSHASFVLLTLVPHCVVIESRHQRKSRGH
jgi:hypothetical protein